MRYTPFSNGTEAMFWQERNCYKCSRRPCAARRTIIECEDMTLRCVRFCGGKPYIQDWPKGAFVNLPGRCASYTQDRVHHVAKRRAMKPRDTSGDIPGLFGGESL